jgi:putative RecB family exonuclease
MKLTRRLEDLDDLERLALIEISYSRLDNYIGCPSRYFYTYIEKLDRTFGAAAALGNIVHGVLELIDEDLDLNEMVKLLEDQKGVYDPEQQISQQLLDAGWQMLVEYVDRHAGERPNVLGREVEFSIVLGSALINGFIDRVEKDSSSLVRVMDYKSGKWEYRGRPKDNLQLGMYALAAADLYGVDEVYAELYYLRSGKRIGHLFTADDICRVEEQVLGLVNQIIEDRFFHPTEDLGMCMRLCDFGKQGICPTGKSRLHSSGH